MKTCPFEKMDRFLFSFLLNNIKYRNKYSPYSGKYSKTYKKPKSTDVNNINKECLFQLYNLVEYSNGVGAKNLAKIKKKKIKYLSPKIKRSGYYRYRKTST